jgi:transcription antitermination factor NusG
MDLVRTLSSGDKIRSAFKFKIGDVIEVIGGHCKGLSGRVVDIPNINQLRVEIQIFNRAIYANMKVEDAKLA